MLSKTLLLWRPRIYALAQQTRVASHTRPEDALCSRLELVVALWEGCGVLLLRERCKMWSWKGNCSPSHLPYYQWVKPPRAAQCQAPRELGERKAPTNSRKKAMQARVPHHLQHWGCRAGPPRRRSLQACSNSITAILTQQQCHLDLVKASALEVSKSGGNEILTEKRPVLPGPRQRLASCTSTLAEDRPQGPRASQNEPAAQQSLTKDALSAPSPPVLQPSG